jgi:hypothetical protein
MSEAVQVKRAPEDLDWRLILRRIRRGQCVPFLGAGASLGFSRGAGLPTASQLARLLADECRFPGADRSDFFRVAQYYRMVFDEHELRQAIRKRLLIPGVQPSVVHEALAGLPVSYVLTTNFDKLMERAFDVAGKAPKVAIYERRGRTTEGKSLSASVEEPLVYKLHGSLDQIHTMVVTEDDVIDFLVCMMAGDPQIPSEIKSLFEQQSILFIGYGLKDMNVRVMMRALRGGRRDAPPDMAYFAIQRRPDDADLAQEWEQTVMFFGKRESLQCFDMDAEEFVGELKRRYDAGEGAE